jgi:hypothetical protein
MGLVDRLRQAYLAVRSKEHQALDAQVIDEARLKTARALLALESHVAVHNCQG